DDSEDTPEHGVEPRNVDERKVAGPEGGDLVVVGPGEAGAGGSGGESPSDDAGSSETPEWGADDDAASTAAQELLEAERAEVERELADLDIKLAAALAEEDYDEAAELDSQMTQVR
ncbi:unnamed protein product, partial [Laminaria digitata]